ncbi:MAG: sel1 repeat family protein [Betaproteobacteria bacterium]|nr:sel1 repeat family protein [Betaproteobacteria bacterium]
MSYEQAQDRAAFIALVTKARQGDAEAQWQVGSTYVRLGDPARAVPMLQSAATAAHPRAAALLGSLYEDGLGTARSAEEAMRWYGFAAEHGQPEAMAALGRLLLAQGGPQEREAAWKWLLQGASLDDRDAQYQLGWLFAQPGAAHDDAKAYQWFIKAAARGHVGAQIAVASQLLPGKGVGRDQKAATGWLERAAATQDPVANYLLGRLHEAEGALARDKARDAYRIAAAAGHRDARFALAVMLAGSPAAADRREAVEWFAKADQDGHRAAANRLGEAYRDGTGVARDFDKAISHFIKSATQGDAQGMYNLARMQNEGLGGPRDTRQALEWYARAAEQGHAGAVTVMEALLNGSLKTSALGVKGFWQ